MQQFSRTVMCSRHKSSTVWNFAASPGICVLMSSSKNSSEKNEISRSVVETTPKIICRPKKIYLRCWKLVPNTTNCFASLTTPPTMHWWTEESLPTLSGWPPVVSRTDLTAWFAFWSCGHPEQYFWNNIEKKEEEKKQKQTKKKQVDNNSVMDPTLIKSQEWHHSRATIVSLPHTPPATHGSRSLCTLRWSNWHGSTIPALLLNSFQSTILFELARSPHSTTAAQEGKWKREKERTGGEQRGGGNEKGRKWVRSWRLSLHYM